MCCRSDEDLGGMFPNLTPFCLSSFPAFSFRETGFFFFFSQKKSLEKAGGEDQSTTQAARGRASILYSCVGKTEAVKSALFSEKSFFFLSSRMILMTNNSGYTTTCCIHYIFTVQNVPEK